MHVLVALAALLAAGLGGCGQRQQDTRNGGLPMPGPRPAATAGADTGSDQAFRQSYRTINIESCVRAGRTRVAKSGGAVSENGLRLYCTCAVDRLMADRSVAELARLQPGPREAAIAEQCGREHSIAINTGGGGAR